MLGNLLGFMNAYNLRFGPGDQPDQRRAYQQLLEILDQRVTRSWPRPSRKPSRCPRSIPKSATEFFERVGNGRDRMRAAGLPAGRRATPT